MTAATEPTGLHPEAAAFLEVLRQAGLRPFENGTVAEARAAIEGITKLRSAPPEPVGRTEDRTCPGGDGTPRPLRLYYPRGAGTGPLPLLVYFHGGGWVTGGIETHDGSCRMLANRLGAIVASLDYRLAPEHRFPAAAEDCWAALRWAEEAAADLGADADRILVGGDSAGGNLAAVAALMVRDRGGPRLVHQLLIYPATDAREALGATEVRFEGTFLSTKTMQWFWNLYLRSPADADHPYASPLRADRFASLPPATVVTAGFDPLRAEGDAYAERLRAAGVPVWHRCYADLFHGFFGLAEVLSVARAAVEEVTAAVREALDREGSPREEANT